jgi:XTP/dITP diphosphohydrolase
VKLVLATNNPGKVREIQAMLGARFDVVTQASLAIPEAEEPHATFVENALAKARHASRAARLPALADDSGLCVDALGGEPGVHSAYYAGHDGTREERDQRNNAKLLASLGDSRRAHYVCLMVFVRHADDPRPLIAEGVWHGEIARTPRGSNGFGYDPLFVLPNGKTAAELEAAEKNRISHRARALERLMAALDGN